MKPVTLLYLSELLVRPDPGCDGSDPGPPDVTTRSFAINLVAFMLRVDPVSPSVAPNVICRAALFNGFRGVNDAATRDNPGRN